LACPCRQTTAFAAPLLREFTPPAGVKVMVLCDAYSRGRTVVQACREPHVHLASPLKRNRPLYNQGWKLHAGRYGRHLVRRRRTEPLVIAKPQGRARYRDGDAGRLQVSTLGARPVVFSRPGAARQLRGLVTDAPELSAAGLLQADDQRWTIEPWVKDVQQLLGLGHDQNRPYRAAVTPRHWVCFAEALLTHRRLERDGAQGPRTRNKAADLSTAAAQDQLRGLLWEDLMTSMQEQPHGQPVIDELERLRVA
jgi:hypothetical protein